MEENFFFVSPFPQGVGFACYLSDTYDLSQLYPEERQILSERAVPKRQHQFFLGRAAAHKALHQIGIEKSPILKGANNEPLWPLHVVGSITHTGCMAVAAATYESQALGLGLDLEEVQEKVDWDIVDRVCLPSEKAWTLEKWEERYWRLFMIFSAKESVFKALFPKTHVFFGFHDARLVWEEEKNLFAGHLCLSLSEEYKEGYTFQVGCQKLEKHVFTFMLLPETTQERKGFFG